MGHRKGSALLQLKNVASKGLFSSYPSIYTHRLKKSLKALYPQFSHFTIISSIFKAESLMNNDSLNFKTLYPLSKFDMNSSNCSLLVLPLAGSGTPAVIASTTQLNFADDLVSPFLLSACVRAVYDLIAFKQDVKSTNFSWFKSDNFERKSNIIRWKKIGSEEELLYQTKFREFLNKGVLISPDRERPSFLPFELSDGEKALLVKLFSSKI